MLMKKMLTTLLAAGMMLTACGSSSTIDTEYSTTTFKDFFIAGGGDVTTWNYLNQGATNNTRVLVNLMSGLLDTNEYGEYVPDLAESYEHNDDYTVWTFKLRDGLNWYKKDGSVYAPIKAQDFITGMEWVLNPENASVCYEMATSNIKGAEEYHDGKITDFSKVGIKALDDKTIQYTMKEGVPFFESVLIYSSFWPANADFLKEVGDKFGNSPDTILYSGAYLLSEYTNDNKKVFSKNEGYWDAENVKVDTIEAIAVKDKESTKELFERGELSHCELAGTQPTAEDRNGNEYMYKSEPLACAYVMFLNNMEANENTQKAINNENFRKALYHGWDRKGYVEITDPLDPEGIYTYTYTSPNTFFTSDGTDYTQLPALKKFHENHYDPTAAADYMAKAKEELAKEGVTFPVELHFYYRSGNETGAQSAEVLKADMEAAFPDEITVALGTYSQSFNQEVTYKHLHSMGGAGWVPDYMDPINILFTFLEDGYMNNSKRPDAQGYSHWNLPEFNELVAKADAETKDVDKRYNLFAEAEAYLLEHAYVIPLYQAGSVYKMAAYNPYSRTYSLTGGAEYRYKRIELSDHALTADELADMRTAWMDERKERGLIK